MDEIPIEVAHFNQDLDELGPINTEAEGVWMITEQWKNRFTHHKEELEPLAESGDILAQYALASIYMLGLTHSSEDEAIEYNAQDLVQASHWLELAAASGHNGALDNLLTIGVGQEAERLRSIYQGNPAIFHDSHSTQAVWESEMRHLHELAYRS